MNNKDFSLSPTGTIKTIKTEFEKIKDPRPKFQIPLSDITMGTFAIFKLKCDSLLSFESRLNGNKGEEEAQNIKNTFFITRDVSDQALKDVVDNIEPGAFNDAFNTLHLQIEKKGLLKDYKLFDKYCITAVDGSQMYTSDKLYSAAALQKKHKNGDITYHMQLLSAVIVAPGKKIVYPYRPEPIQNSDGNTKNDCETNAFKRMLDRIVSDFKDRVHVFVVDSLYAKTPALEAITFSGNQYIANCKEGDHKSLFEEFIPRLEEKGSLNWHQGSFNNKDVQFRFVNDIPIFKDPDSVRCSFIEYKEKQKDGIWKRFTWLTSFKVDLKNIFDIIQAARARWKIENETFNCLKNFGYNFEHNYGLGKKFLRANFAIIMMLAFFSDQINESACPNVQKAMSISLRRSYYWEDIISIFKSFKCNSFDQIVAYIIHRRTNKWVDLDNLLGSQ